VTKIAENNVMETFINEEGKVKCWWNFGNHNIGRNMNITGKLKTNSRFDTLSGWLMSHMVFDKAEYFAKL